MPEWVLIIMLFGGSTAGVHSNYVGGLTTEECRAARDAVIVENLGAAFPAIRAACIKRTKPINPWNFQEEVK